MTKKLISLTLILAIVFAFAACGKKETPTDTASAPEGSLDHPMVKVTMEDGQSFTIELYPEYAPETVANFLKLVNEGFYNGLTFHRIIDGFMAQGGSPDGSPNGGTTTIKGEFASNGFTRNTLEHKRGTVSMARRSDDNNSASCQFFICYARQEHLDGNYAAFGSVVEGMEVVDGFLQIERTYDLSGRLSSPVTPVVMKTVEQISVKAAA